MQWYPRQQHPWNEAVVFWMKLYQRGIKSNIHTWEDRDMLESLSSHAKPHRNILSLIEPESLQRFKVGETKIKFNISISPSGFQEEGRAKVKLVSCIANNCFFSDSEFDKMTSPQFFHHFNAKSRSPITVGQHAVKIYCFQQGAFESGIGDMKKDMLVTLQRLSVSNYSCGSQHLLVEGWSNETAYMDAQIFVSGGARFARSKLRSTGIAQFHNLLRQG